MGTSPCYRYRGCMGALAVRRKGKMNKFFYNRFKEVENLGVNQRPKNKFHECPYCRKELVNGFASLVHYDHDMSFEFGFCLRCGWWDLIYREDDMMGNSEEDTYFHATTLSTSDEIATVSLMNELARNTDKIYEITPRELKEIIEYIYKDILNSSEDALKIRNIANEIEQLNIDEDFNDIVSWLRLGYERYFNFSELEDNLNLQLYAFHRFPREFTTPNGKKVLLDLTTPHNSR